MIIYICCWVAIALISPVMTGLSLYMNKNLFVSIHDLKRNAIKISRMCAALYILFLIVLVLISTLDFLILSTYLTYCDQMKQGKLASAINSLRKALEKSSSSVVGHSDSMLTGELESEVEIERKKAERRLAAYREMADAQINEIMQKIMTLKVVRHESVRYSNDIEDIAGLKEGQDGSFDSESADDELFKRRDSSAEL